MLLNLWNWNTLANTKLKNSTLSGTWEGGEESREGNGQLNDSSGVTTVQSVIIESLSQEKTTKTI